MFEEKFELIDPAAKDDGAALGFLVLAILYAVLAVYGWYTASIANSVLFAALTKITAACVSGVAIVFAVAALICKE